MEVVRESMGETLRDTRHVEITVGMKVDQETGIVRPAVSETLRADSTANHAMHPVQRGQGVINSMIRTITAMGTVEKNVQEIGIVAVAATLTSRDDRVAVAVERVDLRG